MKRLAIALLAATAIAAPAQAAEVQITTQNPVIELSVFEQIEVEPDMATISTGVQTDADTAVEALRRNSAEMERLVALIRALGIPARYVSGYLMMNDRIDQEASHAWAEAHVEGLGWVGFDISNGISPDERYVRVATGRDYRDAAPVTGMSFGTTSTVLEVDVAVEQQQIQQL